MTPRQARCACGALTLRTKGEPSRLSLCHCLECKRRTGTAFGWNATFQADLVEIHGAYRSFTRGSDEGHWVRHHFCAECGISLFYEIERRPNMISIPAGVFADADFPGPDLEVYDERRCAWLPDLGLPQD